MRRSGHAGCGTPDPIAARYSRVAGSRVANRQPHPGPAYAASGSGSASRLSDLLRPDQHTFAAAVAVIDDQCGTEALEVLYREPQILEVHVVAVEIDGRAAHLHPHQPERNVDADDPPVVWIEREDVDRFRWRRVGGGLRSVCERR